MMSSRRPSGSFLARACCDSETTQGETERLCLLCPRRCRAPGVRQPSLPPSWKRPELHQSCDAYTYRACSMHPNKPIYYLLLIERTFSHPAAARGLPWCPRSCESLGVCDKSRATTTTTARAVATPDWFFYDPRMYVLVLVHGSTTTPHATRRNRGTCFPAVQIRRASYDNTGQNALDFYISVHFLSRLAPVSSSFPRSRYLYCVVE